MASEIIPTTQQTIQLDHLSNEALATLEGHQRLARRKILVLVFLVVVAIAAFCIDIATGPAGLSAGAVMHELLLPNAGDSPLGMIIWEVRMPQAIMALLVGMSLSLAGAELQTVLGNPLASPFTIGAASAASFGASIVIVSGLTVFGIAQAWLIPASSFLFAFGAAMLVWAVSRSQRSGADRVVLLGIGLTFAFQALTAIIQFFASATALQQIVFWTMGSLAQSSWDQVTVLALAVLVVLPFSFASAWRLTALGLGEERARSFGIDTTNARLASLLRAILLTATAMCFVGTIGFVGLVGPHITRLLIGEDSRFLLPGALFTGAAVMSLASIASKMVIPGALLPIGVVTAIIGLPIFFLLVFRRQEVS
ncbi:FecCD family ABC transporter permease [Rhizobium sp. SYY.PMSO]|uniref:FecCD family ABC transporter permease n=1 Tax=Rhizobium sp. SYY.PMSO TaxID=3382192 RepID=UPI00399020B4